MRMNKSVIAAAVAAALSVPAMAEQMPEITISGAVEVEASNSEDYDNTSTSDVVVATAALAIDAKINERVSAMISALYEEDDTPVEIDEAIINLQFSDAMNFTAGQMYVPFGTYDSNMVSDPLTLEMGESRETALLLGMSQGALSGSIYAFNGDSEDINSNGDDDEFGFGASFGYATDTLGVGVSYISNIADSDTIQGIGTETAPDTFINVGEVDSSVPGGAISVNASFGSFNVIAEHVSALDNFDAVDFGGGVITAGSEEQPSATNFEVAYTFPNNVTVAAAYQQTDEAWVLGMPESAVSAAVSFEVMEGAGVGIEYITMEDYGTADCANCTGEDADVFTVQLAVEF